MPPSLTFTTRHCIRCGDPIPRHKSETGRLESIPRYNTKQYCGRPCYHAAMTEGRTERTKNLTKACAHCGTPIHPRPNESLASFKTRQYCSLSCAAFEQHGTSLKDSLDRTPKKARKVRKDKQHINPRPCKHCGEPIPIRSYDTPANYALRSYCDNKCSAAARRIPDQVKQERHRERERQRKARIRQREGLKMLADLARDTKPFEPPKHATAGEYRMTTLGTPCTKHPTERVGIYGCPACNTEAAWRKTQGTIRPSAVGR